MATRLSGRDCMRYTFIAAEAAPPKPRPVSKRSAFMDEIMAALIPGKAAELQLDSWETVRGTKAALSRAAKRAGRDVVVWDANQRVYVELGEQPVSRRRRR